MTSKQKVVSSKVKSRPPATSLESKENEMIGLAMDLVEKRLREGTATSQETTHFLRQGTVRARKEQELLDQELKLKKAKTEALESAKVVEELYRNALAAMRSYSGVDEEENLEDD